MNSSNPLNDDDIESIEATTKISVNVLGEEKWRYDSLLWKIYEDLKMSKINYGDCSKFLDYAIALHGLESVQAIVHIIFTITSFYCTARSWTCSPN
jgi:hypothetical protein